jgi:hypothetical protein
VASVLAWIVGAVAAVGVGILALSLIGDGLTSRNVQPLTPDVVAREASAAPSDPPPASAISPGPSADDALTGPSGTSPSGTSPTATASATRPGAGGADKLMWSSGGTAIARCSGTQAYLVSWSPEQGYRVHDVVRGPAVEARVRFDADDRRVFLSVRCAGNEPQATVTQRADDGTGHD